MDLNEIALLAEIVGSIAVVVSLIYVAIQVRQNTRATRSATYQSMVSNSLGLLATMYSEEGNAELYLRAKDGDQDLSPAERVRVHFLLLAVFRHFDNLHYQHARGTIESEQWRGYIHILDGYLLLSGVVAWWDSNSSGFSVGFQKHVTDRLSRASA
jgi:hypothetical protein